MDCNISLISAPCRLNLDLTMQHCRFKVNMIWFYSLVVLCLLFSPPCSSAGANSFIFLVTVFSFPFVIQFFLKHILACWAHRMIQRWSVPEAPNCFWGHTIGHQSNCTSLCSVSLGSTEGNWKWKALDIQLKAQHIILFLKIMKAVLWNGSTNQKPTCY